MYDVTATGELLIDFTRNGLSDRITVSMKPIQEVHHVMYLLCLEN